MSVFYLTRGAQPDLIDIRRYTVKKWGSVQSKKYLSKLRETICLLAETPTLGKLRPDVGLGVISFPYVSHVVYYVENKQQLVIFAVLHKRMVPDSHLAQRQLEQ